MEECELCGKPISDIVYTIEVEGVSLRVCSKCAVGKKIIGKEQLDIPKSPKPSYFASDYKREQPAEDDIELVDNYGEKIRQALEREKLPLKVLAEMISEQESYLKRVIEDKTTPPQELVGKLEKTLGIKLTMSKRAKIEKVALPKSKASTLEDYIKKKD